MSKSHFHKNGWSSFKRRSDAMTSDDFAKGDLVDNTSWQNLDLSYIVPIDCVAVLFRLEGIDNAVNSWMQLRGYETSDTYNVVQLQTQVANNPMPGFGILDVTFQKIQFRCDPKPTDWTNIKINVLGWWLS